MIRAAIDIGSNSVLLSIGEIDDFKLVKEFESQSRVTALSRGLDSSGNFSEQSITDTITALSEYKDILNKYDIPTSEVLVTATEASRVAKNSEVFFQRIRSELDFGVHIISAEGEAYYTSLGVSGVVKNSEDKNIVIIDLGGASTELIRSRVYDGKVLETISLPLGSVRAYEWIKSNEFVEKVEKILKENDLQSFVTSKLICVAGSMTSLVSMIKGMAYFDQDVIEGQEISFKDFCLFIDKIENISPEQLKVEYPFLGKRSETIIAGARLARVLIDHIQAQTLVASTRGLRHGVLVEGHINDSFINQKF